MRMAELSATSGCSVATIKFYLRERLLPPGVSTGRNQADYSEAHVDRLHLIQVLQRVGGLPVARVRELVTAIDDERRPVLDVLGTMQEQLSAPGRPGETRTGHADARRRVDTLLQDRGWGGWAGDPQREVVARLLDTWRELSPSSSASCLDDVLNAYAAAAELVAEADLELVREQSQRNGMVHAAVVGTVIGDALLAGLRRLAQVHVSQKHFPIPSGGPGSLDQEGKS